MFDDNISTKSKNYKLENYSKSHNFDEEDTQQQGPGCQQQ